ncbi:Ig-like domain-containing protein [Methylobacterium sp. J-076]|uniref:Ig-like domain-containing protein n=1 Tax=Methylobacterium sp. J-076 TaxID=2836655 RepID=UPI001FB9EFB3|nr:Ig-like domain-containing protein [Methylobacterium sp. J-076]MCJ2013601.1 Ig-like domain-containing protein [Methylobacterium sp. J-076]
MPVTQNFDSSFGASGNPLIIDGYVYAHKADPSTPVGNISIERGLLSTDASLNPGVAPGYLSISQVSGGNFTLNSLSISRDIALGSTTFIVGYVNNVQVAVRDITNLVALGEQDISLSGTQWQNLTEVRIFNAGSLLDVNINTGFSIDNVATTDITVPVAPTLSAGAGATLDNTPTLTGTAEAGSTVTIYSGATVIGTTTATANGTFSFTPGTALSDGSYGFTARATDAFGNQSAVSAGVSLTIDTLAPTAPVIAPFSGPTNVTRPTITGTAEAGAVITISDNGTPIGTTVAGTNGSFSFTPATALTSGANLLTATASDAAGNVSGLSTGVSLVIDTVVPVTPSLAAVAGPLNTVTPTLAGTAEAGTTVTFFDNGTVIGTTVAGIGGTFSFTPAAALVQGTNLITATARDAAGNVSAVSAGVSLIIDTQAPNVPVIAPVGGSPHETRPTITGSAEAGATVTLFDNGTVIGTTVASVGGTFSFTPTAALSQGINLITATAQDAAGNISTPSTGVSLAIDTVAPNAPVIGPFSGPINVARPTITGTAEAGALVTISDNNVSLGTAVAAGNGTFSFTPGADLGQGLNLLTATARDAAGNLSPASTGVGLTVDTVAPGAPSLTPFVGPINTATPTLTGTAEAGASVTILSGATVLGTAVADANGNFSVTPTSALNQGLTLLTATARDAAGNLSTSSAGIGVTVDTVAPNAPTLLPFTGPANTTTPTLTGTAEAGATVTISDNGTALGIATADTNGAFSFTPVTQLAQGANFLTATARDAAGNLSGASAGISLTIDTVAPTAPTLAAFAAPTNDATPTITGTAEAGTTVTISNGNTVLGTTVATAGNVFSFTPATVLADGGYVLTATARDAAGNLSEVSTGVSLTIDTVAPATPVLAAFAASTHETTPTFTGTAEAGAIVTLLDGTAAIGTAVAAADGHFVVTATTALVEGTASIGVTARDAAGNVSVGPVSPLLVDLTAPSAPTITPFALPTGDATPTITGTAEAGASVTVLSGTTVLGTTTADTNGAFSLTPRVPLPDGLTTLTAIAQDAAGNVSAASAPTALTVNTAVTGAPTVTFLPPTNDSTPIIVGTATAGDLITITTSTGTPLGTGTADADGHFSVELTTQLSEGSNALLVTATGPGGTGTTSPAAPLEVLLDTTVPVAPTIATFPASTNDTTPTVTGTAEAGATVTVLNGATVIGTAVAVANGSFSITPTTPLTQGNVVLTVIATDVAGNASPAASVNVTIDTSAPGVPTITPFGAPINDTTPTVTGTAEAGATVTILNGTSVLGTTVAGTDGHYSFTPSAGLAPGDITLTATATDAAGNVSLAAGTNLTIDTAAPGAPSLTAPGLTTNDTTPTLTGTAEAGATVTVFNGATAIGTAVAGTDGTFTFTPTGALAQGVNLLTATATDVAGNTSAASAGVNLTVDTHAPPMPSLDTVGGPIKTTMPTLTGTAEAGATVTIFDGTTAIGTTVAGTDGTFSFTPTTALGEGANTLTVTATDAAGNVSAASTGVNLTIDTLAPNVPTLAVQNGPINTTTPTLTGTAEAGTTVTVYDNGAAIGTAVVGINGTFTLTPTTGLMEGANSLTATATDTAGNVSAASAGVNLTVDTVAPGTPSLTGLPVATNDTTPVISGTAEAGTTVTIFDNGAVIGTAVAGAGNSFSVTPTTALREGANTLTVTATDAAGNTSAASAGVNLTVDTVAPVGLSITTLPGTTNDATPVITGTAEAGTTVTVSNGTTVLGTAVAGANGTYSLVPTTALGEGANTLTATATDAAGNVSQASVPATLVIDTTPPAAGTLALSDLIDTGPSHTDHITSATSFGLALAGQEQGSTVAYQVSTDGGATYTGTTVAQTNLADGHYLFHAVVTDGAGNSATTEAVALTVDTKAPQLTALHQSFTHVNGQDSVTFAGHVGVEAGTTVHVFDGTRDLGAVAVDGQGNWAYSGALGAGSHSLHAEAIDLAGNATVPQALPTVNGDTATFGFRLVDAGIEDRGGIAQIFGPDGSSTTVTGLHTFVFSDGVVNENDGSPLVDDLFYYANNHDVWQAGVDADTHYATFGWHEGRDPNASFSTLGYLAANRDVAEAGVNPLTHYDTYGWKEGRDPSAHFDNELYLARNPDVKAAGVDPLAHYISFGQAEGREAYAAVGRATDLNTHSGFDAEFYLLSNTDVAKAALSAGGDSFAFAYQHYETYGWHEGRNPNAVFDTKGYLAAYTDVKAANFDPLLHYDTYGWKEGRDPSAGFDTKTYEATYTDVKAAGIDPMEHYLQFGAQEGRSTFGNGTFG